MTSQEEAARQLAEHFKRREELRDRLKRIVEVLDRAGDAGVEGANDAEFNSLYDILRAFDHAYVAGARKGRRAAGGA